MTFNLEISVGNIISLCALIGSVVLFVFNKINQVKTKGYAENANAYNESAKKCFDLAADQLENINDKNDERLDFLSPYNLRNSQKIIWSFLCFDSDDMVHALEIVMRQAEKMCGYEVVYVNYDKVLKVN